jgi:UDP-glucose 4-epimerase
MRILFTAASSFTGSWFIKALAAAGHEIVGTLQRKIGDYEGLRRERVEQVQALARLAPEVSFGSESFLKLLKQSTPFDLLCHHAAELRNHKSPDFDVIGAVQNNARRLPEVITTFKQNGGKAILLTGTIYEPDEGHGSEPLRAFSPYGLSKGLTWQVFRYYCETGGMPLGKFVMPNPFGPWEDRGFTLYLMTAWEKWKSGRSADTRLYPR